MSPAGPKDSGKRGRLPRRVRVMVDVHRVRAGAHGLEAIPCPKCRSSLTIHQPDPHGPDQFLGVCASCGEWFVVWLGGDPDHGLAIHLPLGDILRDVSSAS